MRLHLFDCFFLCYSESMFLIDDEKSESSESDIFREKSMGSDYDIDRSELHLFEYFFDIFGMCHASERPYPYAESSEALFEGFSMFFGEDEEGRYDSNLDS